MKKVLLVVGIAIGTAAFAQQNAQTSPQILPTNIVQKGVAATYSDVYCAGWMSPQDVSNNSYVLAGEQSPNTSRFVKNDSIYLSGTGWQEGQKLSIVRRAKDPNYFKIYDEQAAEIKKAGLLFFDMAQATVTFVDGNTAVAHIDFSCDGVVPGDLVIPFQERSLAAFRPRPYNFQHFVALKGATTGRIILAREFDIELGEGKKFFVNIGANQGLKPGDYLRIFRGYKYKDLDPTDQASENSMSYEDDQFKEPQIKAQRFSELPRRSVGEAVILTTTPTTATGMITYAIEDVHIGDRFEVMPPATDENAGNN